jgi:putative membrane protein insertion efficiency factor
MDSARRRKARVINHFGVGTMIPVKFESRMPQVLLRAPRTAGRALVKAYRFGLAPLIGMNCRHLPSCSEYADEALDRYGLWAGSWMMLARILRCHPWGTSGLDFVPATLHERARWWLPWRYGRWRGTNAAAVAAPACDEPAG